MIVQIYEIQTPEEAERCLRLGVDHIGSVLLSAEEWRQPAIRDVIGLTRGKSAKSSLIPLFPEEDLLFRCMDYYRPDFVHFCESLTDEQGHVRDLGPVRERQIRLKERYPEIGIIRTLPIPGPGRADDFPSLEIAAALEESSDFFLTDTWMGREPVEGYLGITGRPGDLGITRNVVNKSRIPVILAGGMSPANVYESVCYVQPAGADSCTLTNAADPAGQPLRFKKDFDKVAAFVAEVRRAEKDLQKSLASKS
jgi:phosphoribosylanthranilate isomerase